MLIIDEIRYLPPTRDEASLLLPLITRRYERASLVLTSNKNFLDWARSPATRCSLPPSSTGSCTHATTLHIKAESYRLKEKRTAGLLEKKAREAGRQEGGLAAGVTASSANSGVPVCCPREKE